MSPAKKENSEGQINWSFSKKELLKSTNIITEFLLFSSRSKSEGIVRLCVDYRKLSDMTLMDSYPLFPIGDLLHEAKHTDFM